MNALSEQNVFQLPVQPATPSVDRNKALIGHSNIEGCTGYHLDVPKLMATRMLIQAASGGGKSYALRRILEQTHGFVQQIIIDPEGELVTLAEQYDYVVCGSGDGNVRLTSGNGRRIADLIFKSGRSAIICLSELDVEEMQEFVKGFLESLISQPQEVWHYILVAIDEAQLFAPQHGKAESKKAMIDLATRGRKRGLCPVVATQRISNLHKGVAAQLDNKLIGLTTLDVDVERAADQLGMRLPAAKLALKLPAGEFLAYGPALTYDIRTVRIAPVNTRHGCLLSFGEHVFDPRVSNEDLREAFDAMNASVEAAEAEAATVAEASNDDEFRAAKRKERRAADLQKIAELRYAAIAPLLDLPPPGRRDGKRTKAIAARARKLGMSIATLSNLLTDYEPDLGLRSLIPRRVAWLSAKAMGVLECEAENDDLKKSRRRGPYKKRKQPSSTKKAGTRRGGGRARATPPSARRTRATRSHK